jgi:cell fate (sporulation/competence/biofilm development) regulator YmcA (YheA/YmcA/DUF963 family)
MYVKVKDTPNLVRDMQNQAVLNSDLDGLKAYKLKREKQQEINSAVDDINNIKQDINDLKTLMQRILDKIG